MGLYGGSKTVHKTTENPYDDQWIKDWISEAETTGADLESEVGNFSGYVERLFSDIGNLQRADKGYTSDISGLTSTTGTLRTDVDVLKDQLANWDTTTEVGDVQGLDDIISGLKDKYTGTAGDVADLKDKYTGTAGDVSDLQKGLAGTQYGLKLLLGDGAGSIKGQITKATDALGINDYLKTSDFNTRMTENLDALSQTLSGQWGEDIASLDLEGVRQSIADQGGDLSALTENFAGLTSDMDWIKQLDLGGIDDRINTQGTNLTNLITQQGENLQTQLSDQQTQWKGDLTNLQNVLESGRGEALANLESQLGTDRAADLLDLKQQLEEGRLSDIQGMAGNLRQEFGDQVFDLSDTFDQRLGDVQTALGGDISKLFKESGSLQSGLDTLTSGLGTTTQQLEALRDSFGDYKTDAATNLANVEAAFGKQVGDLGTDFTKQLGDLQSSTAADILGLSQQTGKDIEGVRSALSGDISDVSTAAQEGIAGAKAEASTGLASLSTKTAEDIAGAKAEAAAGLKELGTTVTEDRRKALSDLDTTWSANLLAQDKRLQDQFQKGSDAFNKRLSDISSSMNYKMLGDSAQGVKIRRSRAYNTGRTRSGTGQLGRSMKISTLNI
tara:strand:- start:1638 stop:3479 length:1842 start_codon:yes stop_codon:yes gene_type:complete